MHGAQYESWAPCGVERFLGWFMKINYLFVSSLFVLFIGFLPNISNADSPNCVQRQAVVTFADLPSLQQTFPYSGYQVGDPYFYSVPNSECIARNMAYYGYYPPYQPFDPYYYPSYPYPMTWRWSMDYRNNVLVKENSFCVMNWGLFDVRYFTCR